MLTLLRGTSLVVVAFVAGAAASASADINLEFRLDLPHVHVGDTFEVRLYATSDDANDQYLGAIEAIISWPSAFVQLQGVLGGGDAPLIFEGFIVSGSSGLNESNPPQDGDGLYTALGALGVAIPATPAGTLITTLEFVALAPTPAAEVGFIETAGSPPRDTVVFSGVVPNLVVTGALIGLDVEVRPLPCGPADLNEDGVLDFFDVQMFLQGFSDMDSISDFATPFGTFDFFDVQEYLQLFSEGCVR